MTLKQVLEEFINTLNFDGCEPPTCHTVHPHVHNTLSDLERSIAFKDLWTDQLTKLQQVERHCLANELKLSLQNYLSDEKFRAIESANLQHILLYVISAAWLVHEKVILEMGGESNE